MRVDITDPAARDLAEIRNYIATDSSRRALAFVLELERVCTVLLREAPFLGRARDDLAPGVRVFPHRGYLICYDISGDVVRILRVLHGSVDLARRF